MSTGHAGNQTVQLSAFPDSKVDMSLIVLPVLFVYTLSPVILFGNLLILYSGYRFRRLRTPSNYLLFSLATSDFAVGLFLPAGIFIEFTESGSCLVIYCSIITLCNVSVIAMAAIAVDRYTSLAQPLRYNDLIKRTSVLKYLTLIWLYSAAVGFSPALSSRSKINCFFSNVVTESIQIFLFCSVYGPCCVIVVFCYAYIYILARHHAKAIYTLEISIRQGGGQRFTVSRYGQTLAITVGCFVCLWMPFQACMLLYIINGRKLFEDNTSLYLSLLMYASSAIDPWVYGYRNSETRTNIQKVIREMLKKLGFPSGSSEACKCHGEQTELNSLASNMRCTTSPNRMKTSFLFSTTKTNGYFDKNTTFLTVPEGEIEFVVNSIPNVDELIVNSSGRSSEIFE